jgi:hypothetical protein
MNVIINEEQIKREQIIVIYTFVLDGKSLMMNYVFYMLRFTRIYCNTNISNKKSHPIFILYSIVGMGKFFDYFFQTIPVCLNMCFSHIIPNNTQK